MPVADGAYATIPAWTSRDVWLDQVAAALDSTEGRALCRAHRVSAASARAVAAAHASYADTTTGRSVTAAVSTLAAHAGVSTSVVSRTRRVLLALHLAREVVCGRHLSVDERVLAKATHGGRQISAASVWALSTPSTQVKQRDSLPSPKTVSSSSPVGKKSPKPRTRGRNNPRREAVPRPLHTQRAAAQLAARLAPCAPRLGRMDRSGRVVDTEHVHVGAIAHTLTALGIDTERWTGHDIADAIDAQNAHHGWTATRIESPVAWLRHRLLALADTWTGPSPADRRRAHLAQIAAESAARAAARAAATPASAEARAAAMAEIRAAIARRDKPRVQG